MTSGSGPGQSAGGRGNGERGPQPRGPLGASARGPASTRTGRERPEGPGTSGKRSPPTGAHLPGLLGTPVPGTAPRALPKPRVGEEDAGGWNSRGARLSPKGGDVVGRGGCNRRRRGAPQPQPAVLPHPREGSAPPGPQPRNRRGGCERAGGPAGSRVRRVGAPHTPSPAGLRPRRGAGARPSRGAAARTHRALGRQVADVLDGADVDDVDAAVLGRERRVLLVDPHLARLCAGTAGRRALAIHGPGGLCRRTRLRSRAPGPGLPPRPAPPGPCRPGPRRAPPAAPLRTHRPAPGAPRCPPGLPPAPQAPAAAPAAPTASAPCRPGAPASAFKNGSALRPLRAGAAATRDRFSIEMLFHRNLNAERKVSIPAGPLQVSL